MNVLIINSNGRPMHSEKPESPYLGQECFNYVMSARYKYLKLYDPALSYKCSLMVFLKTKSKFY